MTDLAIAEYKQITGSIKRLRTSLAKQPRNGTLLYQIAMNYWLLTNNSITKLSVFSVNHYYEQAFYYFKLCIEMPPLNKGYSMMSDNFMMDYKSKKTLLMLF